jgi:hypothetical protein
MSSAFYIKYINISALRIALTTRIYKIKFNFILYYINQYLIYLLHGDI